MNNLTGEDAYFQLLLCFHGLFTKSQKTGKYKLPGINTDADMILIQVLSNREDSILNYFKSISESLAGQVLLLVEVEGCFPQANILPRVGPVWVAI